MTTYCLDPNQTWLAVYDLNTGTMPTDNVVFSELISNLASNGTSATIKAGEGSLFTQGMIATIEEMNAQKKVVKREVVLISGITDNVLTLTRGYEKCVQDDTATPKTLGNTAQSFSSGAKISVYVSKALLNGVQTRLQQVNNPHLIATECCRVTVCNRLMNSCDCWKQCIEVLNQQCFTNGGFGSGCDGDCVMTGNVYLCANRVYQFENLTICPGAVVRFEGQGVPQIKVYNKFINNGTIDTRAGFVKNCCCSKTVCYAGLNTCAKGKGCNSSIVPYCAGTGNCGIMGSGNQCTGAGRQNGCPGCCGNASCGGAGGKGGDNYSYCCNCWNEGYAGCPASGENGGNGGAGAGYSVLSGGDYIGGGGGGGGGGGRFGNGGNGGNGATGGGNPNARSYSGGFGGKGGNSGLWGKGGNGGGGGYAGVDAYPGTGGNGGCGYIGGQGGEGGSSGFMNNRRSQSGGTGGNGGDGVICGGNGGNAGCSRCARGPYAIAGNGGNAITNVYGLIMNVRCTSGTGKIVACGGKGGNGGNTAGGYCNAGTGGNGGNGADGGQVVYIYQTGTPEQILVNGGAGGSAGCGNICGTDGCPGTAGTDGWKCIYQITN